MRIEFHVMDRCRANWNSSTDIWYRPSVTSTF